VTTGSDGSYEFLNLALGDYTIVKTPLAGYSSKNPANSRLTIELTTLTLHDNNDFFDFVPAAIDYATISGTVWNDANVNAIEDNGEVGLGNVTVQLVQDLNGNEVADPGEPVVSSILTASNGTYTFYAVVAGDYVVRKTN